MSTLLLRATPNERVQLLTADAKALYASGSDGRSYLVWQRSGILVAQEFDVLVIPPAVLKWLQESVPKSDL